MTSNIARWIVSCGSSWGSCFSLMCIVCRRLGLIPIATAFAGFCPAYRLLGLNTCNGLVRRQHYGRPMGIKQVAGILFYIRR